MARALLLVTALMPVLALSLMPSNVDVAIDSNGDVQSMLQISSAFSSGAQSTRNLIRSHAVNKEHTERQSPTLNAATCTEAVLIEPRAIRGIARAAESALASHQVDLVTLAHGQFNAGYVDALVSNSANLSDARQKGKLRYLALHVGDLGGDALGSSKAGVSLLTRVTDLAFNILNLGSPSLVQLSTHGKQAHETVYHDEYSRLLKSTDFWKQFACDRILIMQSDSMFCPGSTAKLSDFFGYGFVGGHTPHMDSDGKLMLNGGFSLRSRPQTLQCLGRNPDPDASIESEDSYYSKGTCTFLTYPPAAVAERFSVDNAWTYAASAPLGVHKPWGVGPYGDHTMDICHGSRELQQEQKA